MKRIRPLHDRVVVKPLEELSRTAGGIVIPDTAAQKPVRGEVVAVGRGKRLKDGNLRALDVKTGDKVLFGEYAGDRVKVSGEELIVMREDDITGILDAKPRKKLAKRTILVPVDGSPTGSRGLRQAIALAKADRARLVLLYVVDESAAYADFESGASADLVRALVRDGHRILKRARSLAGRHGKDARTLLRESVGEPVAEEIVRQAKRLHCDLIVMGTHARHRGARRVPGKRGARVARDSPVPVLLVPHSSRQ